MLINPIIMYYLIYRIGVVVFSIRSLISPRLRFFFAIAHKVNDVGNFGGDKCAGDTGLISGADKIFRYQLTIRENDVCFVELLKQ